MFETRALRLSQGKKGAEFREVHLPTVSASGLYKQTGHGPPTRDRNWVSQPNLTRRSNDTRGQYHTGTAEEIIENEVDVELLWHIRNLTRLDLLALGADRVQSGL